MIVYGREREREKEKRERERERERVGGEGYVHQCNPVLS